jgi:PAS domain-containing protein
MRRVCAWCNKPLGEIGPDEDIELVTHGVCPECEAFVASNEPRSLRRFIDLFTEPIVCVNDNYSMLTANDAAVQALGLADAGDDRLLCGQVVHCRWACSPGGCGSTEHCLACNIRKIVRESFESGTMFFQEPAYVERVAEDGTIRRVRLLLTSERRGEALLLRIDGVEEYVA